VNDATLDQKTIDEIRAIPSPNLLNRMIQLYHEHTPRLVHEGRGAIAADDCTRIGVAAHELKSASANLGASKLARLCRDCELAAKRNDAPAARELWPSILAEHQAVLTALVALRNLEHAA
jgi:HPt (histidine-containing phosphotransfer) domain-containing protein